MEKYILSLDQGTTSSRAILFDSEGQTVASAQREFTQIYPKPSWVEHDPNEIYESQISVMRGAVLNAGVSAGEIAAIGIANQRETTIVWDKATGEPIYNAIVWQCRRTAPQCETLAAKGLSALIKEKTGLELDAYFSATKLSWLLKNVPGAAQRAQKGELLFGTVDSFLLWRLTGGKVHATDYTNASRTMLFNIHTLQWDAEICEELGIPLGMLPQVKPSGDIFGYTDILGAEIPVAGIAGDQQAALFGQACFEKGEIKNTYGTGCFLLANTGGEARVSKHGLVTTVAAGLKGEQVQYALEGSVFTAGAAVQWLRDEMKMIDNAAETAGIAKSAETNGGVYIVPAFTGLGAPHWNMDARGSVFGLTRGATRAQFVRAALESIAFQTQDVLRAISADLGGEIETLCVDGGASANEFLMQFQADISNLTILRCNTMETTALGAAYLAGLTVGVFKDRAQVKEKWLAGARFESKMGEEERAQLLAEWQRAVDSTLHWAQG